MGAIPSLKTNLTSIMARRNLTKANSSLKSNIEKLSTGQRINAAEDDAAGLAVSESMKAELRSLGEARRNANDGISMLQTADGSLGEIHDILGRMKELAVQANSDSINDSHRQNLDQEYRQLTDELNDIAQGTNFNDVELLDGSFTGKSMQVGENASDKVEIDISQNFDGTHLGKEFSIANANVLTVHSNGTAPAKTGQVACFAPGAADQFLKGHEYRIKDGNGNEFIGTVKAVTGTNGQVISFGSSLTAAKVSATVDFQGVGSISGAGIDTRSHASYAAAAVNNAIETVSRNRADIGAKINRLGKKVSNIDLSKENLSSANSRIRDVDVAKEMADLTKNQIITQAGTTMLSQANSRPQAALTLLGGG